MIKEKQHKFKFGEDDIKKERKNLDTEMIICWDATPEIRLSIIKKRKEDIEVEKREKNAWKTIATQIDDRWKASDELNMPLAVYYRVNPAVLDIPLDIVDENNLELDPIDAYVDIYKDALTRVQVSFDTFFQWFRLLEDLENEERRDKYDYQDRRLKAVRKAIFSLIPEFVNLRVRRSSLRMTVEKEGE